MKEPKNERFCRLAEARVNKIISMIGLLGNCSRKGNYTYTEEQVDKIFSSIQKELDKAHKRYQTSMKNTCLFSLSEEDSSHVPSVSLLLPDGSTITAKAIGDDFPAINIYLTLQGANEEELIAFAEFNPTKAQGKELCVGAYTCESDDTTYYRSYYEERNKNEI